MGASVSSSSPPSRPAKCSLWETRSTTRLFTVPDYSNWVQMAAGSALLFDDTIHLQDLAYHLKVYPAGYDREAVDYVAVFAERTDDSYYSSNKDGAKILIEILDGGGGERTVFDNHTAKSEQTLSDHGRSRGYVRFVSRRELEVSDCVSGDSFTIRCTVSVDVKVTRSSAEVMEALTAAASDPSKTQLSRSRVLTIGGFSRIKAGLRNGECVHSTQFSLGGSSWYIKVYPNGHCKDSGYYYLTVCLCRGRSDELATTVKFSFEVDEHTHTDERFAKAEHKFHHDQPEHEVPYFTYFQYFPEDTIIDDDRLIIRCHLRVIKAATPSLVYTEDPPTVTIPPSDGTDQDA